MPDPLETLRRIDPAYMKGFDAANGATNGVAALARAAMKAGATKEEIAETVRVAVNLGGVGAAYTASEGLSGVVA